MPDILCIGNGSYDIYFVVEEYPVENLKYATDVFLESPGGPAANACYLLGFWGISSGFAGLVGDDSYGYSVAEEFRSVGSDIVLMEIRAGHHTPLSCVIVNTANGSRTIINRRSSDASIRFSREELSRAAPKFLLFDGHEHEMSLTALDLFPDAVSVLDSGSVRPAAVDLAGRVDYFVGSEKFALEYTGLDALNDPGSWIKALDALLDLNGKSVGITLGGRGLIYAENGEKMHMSGFAVNPVDSTGAGDIFHGAFIYALHRGDGFREALRFSSAVSAISVTRRGGRRSIPGPEEVAAFLAQRTDEAETRLL
ncbi:MAG: carbohydrate kinase family protein [bacterium]